MAGAAGGCEQPEAYSVQLIGAPLLRNAGGQQSASEAELEVIFEVRGNHAQRPPWRLQRGYSEIVRLHQQLTSELPGAALPRLPEARAQSGGKMKRFFRKGSDDTEDQRLRELAELLEEYLNTVLAIPSTGACANIPQALQLFLNIPQVEPSQPPATPTEFGEAAAETVTSSCAAICQSCQAFFARLLQPGRQPSSERFLGSGPGSGPGSEDGMSLQGDRVDSLVSSLSTSPSFGDLWIADNSRLRATTPGVEIHLTAVLTDKDGEKCMPWGTVCAARLFSKDWLEIDTPEGIRFVPRFYISEGVLKVVMRPYNDGNGRAEESHHEGARQDSGPAPREGCRATGRHLGGPRVINLPTDGKLQEWK